MVREGGSAEVFIRFAMVRSVEVSGGQWRSVVSQGSSETVLNKQEVSSQPPPPTRYQSGAMTGEFCYRYCWISKIIQVDYW